MERNILTVAHVNAYVKQLMDKDYILKNIWVQGEVSNFKAHSSGHFYFTLKDSKSSVLCVMFRSQASQVGFALENGMRIIVAGSVSVYERSGQYQIYVRKIIEDGLGKLYTAYEELKKTLEKEGLFDSFLKKELPRYVRHIGIVTSATGAAIEDMVHVANRRNPYVQLTLYPSLVQGSEAADNLIDGIVYFDQKKEVDLIVIGRGGGSIEDLWPFNEARVARAIHEASTPIISAVGHETDFTIADFVADYRAPTPSAAMEVAVYDYNQFVQVLNSYTVQMNRQIKANVAKKKQQLALWKLQLTHAHPMYKYQNKYQLIGEFEDKIKYKVIEIVKRKRHHLSLLEEQLQGKSPLNRLKEGYGYIRTKTKDKVVSVEELKEKDLFTLILSDGKIVGQVQEIIKETIR